MLCNSLRGRYFDHPCFREVNLIVHRRRARCRQGDSAERRSGSMLYPPCSVSPFTWERLVFEGEANDRMPGGPYRTGRSEWQKECLRHSPKSGHADVSRSGEAGSCSREAGPRTMCRQRQAGAKPCSEPLVLLTSWTLTQAPVVGSVGTLSCRHRDRGAEAGLCQSHRLGSGRTRM